MTDKYTHLSIPCYAERAYAQHLDYGVPEWVSIIIPAGYQFF